MLCLRRILSVVHRQRGERIRENTLYRKNWMSCFPTLGCKRSPRSSGGFSYLRSEIFLCTFCKKEFVWILCFVDTVCSPGGLFPV